MGSQRVDEDRAAEFILRRIDELRIYAVEIGEDNAIELLEEAFQGILGRYHSRKIERLFAEMKRGDPGPNLQGF